MTTNTYRVGNFTSSEIVALTKEPTAAAKKTGAIFGAPALTYIAETNFERRLGRSITDEVYAKPIMWGKALEPMVFDMLGLEYTYSSDVTIVHPSVEYWAGSKDGSKVEEGGTVFDIKCPFTLKSFCQLVQPLYDGLQGMAAMDVIRDTHKDGEKYYWQLVSNAILDNAKYAELIVFMPYKSELSLLKMTVDGNPNGYFISMAGDNELPFLPDNGYYKNLNIIRFEVPEEDKALLTSRVREAGKLLISYPDRLPTIEESTHTVISPECPPAPIAEEDARDILK